MVWYGIIVKKGGNRMIKYEERRPTPEELNYLLDSAGWRLRDEKIIQEALNCTLYSLCAFDDDQIIGYVRIIGDKTIFLHIHDLLVLPQYQKQNVGTELMNRVLQQIKEFKNVNPNINVYLGATKGNEEFYTKFGFTTRPNDKFGAGMVLE